MAATFTPPIFSNLGKSASDLFKKKFDDKKDFKNIVQVKNKTKSGLVFTTGGEYDLKNILSGSLKITYKEPAGEIEASASTRGPAKIELKLKKLAKGLTVIITGDTTPHWEPSRKPPLYTSPTGKLALEYAQDFFAGTAFVETSFFKPSLLAGSAVIGFDGLSVGGEVKLDPNEALKDLNDYNVGAQYSGSDFVATLKTSEQTRKLTAQYVHTVAADLTVGGEFSTRLDEKDERLAGLSAEYKVSGDTVTKIRADSAGTIAVAIEHRLPKPRLQIALASAWDAAGFSLPKPKQFGLGLTFGDYNE